MNKVDERRKAIVCMEYLARQINDEDVLDSWLMCGVADGDIDYGNLDATTVEDWYIEDDNFKDIMSTFLICMKNAYRSGGLYCGDVVSRTKGE